MFARAFGWRSLLAARVTIASMGWGDRSALARLRRVWRDRFRRRCACLVRLPHL